MASAQDQVAGISADAGGRRGPVSRRHARTRPPSRAVSRSQDSKAAAIKETPSHAEFIAKSCEGNRPIPQSFPVRMQPSTLACTR
jgi:hypothetical protein